MLNFLNSPEIKYKLTKLTPKKLHNIDKLELGMCHLFEFELVRNR